MISGQWIKAGRCGTASPATSRTPLFRVGLFCWVRIGESRDGHAGVVGVHDPRIEIDHTVEGLGRRHLCDEADVRDGRPTAMAEPATRGMFSEQGLYSLEASAEPCWIQASLCSSLTFSTSVK